MGDPKKTRKTYTTPRHPWQAIRMEEEKELVRKYGLSNKKEIHKMRSRLIDFKNRVKKLGPLTTAQAELERKQLHEKLVKLGLLKQEDPVDNTLGIELKDVLERRLQTILVTLERARTVKQARQMITHGHVIVNNKKITSPSYLTTLSEEGTISFSVTSPFMDETHPERAQKETAPKPIKKEIDEDPNFKEQMEKPEVKEEAKEKPKAEEPAKEEVKAEEKKEEAPKAEEKKEEAKE